MPEKKIDISLDGNTSMLVLNTWLDALQEQDRERYVLLISSRNKAMIEKGTDIVNDSKLTTATYRIEFKIPLTEDQKERFAQRLFKSISASDIIPALMNDQSIRFDEYSEDDFISVFCEKYTPTNMIPVRNVSWFVCLFDRIRERNIIAPFTNDGHNILEYYFRNEKTGKRFTYESLKAILSKAKKKLNDGNTEAMDNIIDDCLKMAGILPKNLLK